MQEGDGKLERGVGSQVLDGIGLVCVCVCILGMYLLLWSCMW